MLNRLTLTAGYKGMEITNGWWHELVKNLDDKWLGFYHERLDPIIDEHDNIYVDVIQSLCNE